MCGLMVVIFVHSFLFDWLTWQKTFFYESLWRILCKKLSFMKVCEFGKDIIWVYYENDSFLKSRWFVFEVDILVSKFFIGLGEYLGWERHRWWGVVRESAEQRFDCILNSKRTWRLLGLDIIISCVYSAIALHMMCSL